MYFPDNVKVFNVDQRQDEWRFLRGNYRTPIKGKIPDDWCPYLTPFRFTASEIYCLTDLSRFKSRETYLGEVLGTIPKTFTGNHHTRRGQRLEPLIKEMYETKNSVKVSEVGFVVPSWCPYIGVSPDGIMDEGCIEIKSPVHIYPELLEEGIVKPEHYAQMQMAMVICDRDWCDYILYSESDDMYFEKRISRDFKYWNEELYPQILSGIEHGREVVCQTIIKGIEHPDAIFQF